MDSSSRQPLEIITQVLSIIIYNPIRKAWYVRIEGEGKVGGMGEGQGFDPTPGLSRLH